MRNITILLGLLLLVINGYGQLPAKPCSRKDIKKQVILQISKERNDSLNINILAYQLTHNYNRVLNKTEIDSIINKYVHDNYNIALHIDSLEDVISTPIDVNSCSCAATLHFFDSTIWQQLRLMPITYIISITDDGKLIIKDLKY